MSVGFSKAPEGATHYRKLVSGVAWYKVDGNGISMASDEDGWLLCGRSLAELTPIPAFEPFVSVEDAPTTGSKHDSGKPLMGAVPPNALLAVAKVLTFGAEKYGAEKYGRDNWRQVESAETRYLDAALRHINAHLAHAVCSLMFMLELQEGV